MNALPCRKFLHVGTAMIYARACVTHLESAMEVVGESDPSCSALLDALKRARVQAQNRPVEERIASTE